MRKCNLLKDHDQAGNHVHVSLIDQSADPIANTLQLYKEELKAHLEGAVQKLVMLRYPGVNPGLNLLRNPSFEVDADGTNPPTGWRAVVTGGEVDDADKVDGTKSVKIKTTSLDTHGVDQLFFVKKGQYIRASVACKTSIAAHGCLLLYSATLGIMVHVHHSGGGTWEFLSGVYGPLPQDIDDLRYIVRKDTGGAVAIWFDQAVLEVFDAPFSVPRRIRQAAQPTPAVGELVIWSDSDDDRMRLVYNDEAAGVKSVEMI